MSHIQWLSDEFIKEVVEENPNPLNELGEFVFYRTYSRWLPSQQRREYWWETCRRSISYNIGLAEKHLRDMGYAVRIKELKEEAQKLFKNMYNIKQFLSGRTMWVGGAENSLAERYPMSNYNCLERDTEFLTDEGIKSFNDFNDGDKVNVLGKTGGWKEATVRNFGKAHLKKITVRKGKRTEEMYATGNHRWIVLKGGKDNIVVTDELKEGYVLKEKKRYAHTSIVPCKVGTMHGIVYGDGTYDKNKNHTRVALCGDKQALLPHFITGSVCTVGERDQRVVYGLPSGWKALPKLTVNIEYIFGFLQGLVATDGSVQSSVTVSATCSDTIDWVRSAAQMCGIRTGKISVKRKESNFGEGYADCLSISLNREDMDKSFFVLDKHREAFENPEKVSVWKVVAVEETDRYEDVWCVQEPEYEAFTLANGILTKNCAFLSVRSWYDLCDLFYLLMVGTGVGFKCTPELAEGLEPIRTNVNLIHSEYKPVPKSERLEKSHIHFIGEGYAKIYVGDSKEGWVEALRLYLDVLINPEYGGIHTVKVSYNSVRPRGERLKTFGGTASGHTSLLEMFDGIDRTLRNQIDPSLEPLAVDYTKSKFYADARMEDVVYKHVRPIHILDIGNLIGNNVVVGGVRRTAEIFLMDSSDWESIWAKYGMNGFWEEKHFEHHEKVRQACIDADIPVPAWFDELSVKNFDPEVNGDQPFNYGRQGIYHRAMSNNSIAYEKKPSRGMLHMQFTILQGEGEPCFVNMEEAKRRRPNAEGLNPCVEIILASYGLCNLTTINVKAFVYQAEDRTYKLDLDSLFEAQRLSARAGLRMTLVDLELPKWDKVQKRDRLLGCSVTGWYDALDLLDWGKELEQWLENALGEVARNEADKYASELRVANPLLVTAVKPEGTLSQVAGGVSSGLHRSHSPYYIRRIRINSADKLAQAAKSLDWDVRAENFTVGETEEERLANAKTWVIKFPVKSDCKVTKFDVSVKSQFDTYFSFQKRYTEHNSSNTITVRPEEWAEAEQIVWDNWDNFVGVSFLQLDGGTYQQAPYEAITEEQYNELKDSMVPFDIAELQAIEREYEEMSMVDDDCVGGACPIR